MCTNASPAGLGAHWLHKRLVRRCGGFAFSRARAPFVRWCWLRGIAGAGCAVSADSMLPATRALCIDCISPGHQRAHRISCWLSATIPHHHLLFSCCPSTPSSLNTRPFNTWGVQSSLKTLLLEPLAPGTLPAVLEHCHCHLGPRVSLPLPLSASPSLACTALISAHALGCAVLVHLLNWDQGASALAQLLCTCTAVTSA